MYVPSIYIKYLLIFRNPNAISGGGITKWGPISKKSVNCLVISENPYTKEQIFSERAKLYNEFYENKFEEN